MEKKVGSNNNWVINGELRGDGTTEKRKGKMTGKKKRGSQHLHTIGRQRYLKKMKTTNGRVWVSGGSGTAVPRTQNMVPEEL